MILSRQLPPKTHLQLSSILGKPYWVASLRFYRSINFFFFRNKYLNVFSQMMNSFWWLSNLSLSLYTRGWLNAFFLEQTKRIMRNCLSMTFSEHKHCQSSLSDLSTTFQQMHTILERLPGNFPSHLLFIKLPQTHSEVKKQKHLCLCSPWGINWCYNFSNWIVM